MKRTSRNASRWRSTSPTAASRPRSVGFELLGSEDTADAMIAFAERVKPGLLVLATHGRTGLRRTLLGSVSEEVVRRASGPVLTVRRTSS